MNKFNLTFSGEILPGYDPARAKATLAEILALEDPAQVERCFTGKTVILLRDLDRKGAAERFALLKKVGLVVALEKIAPEADTAENVSKPQVSVAKNNPEPKPTPKTPLPNRGMDHEIREQNIGRIDQSWPVSKAVTRPPTKAKPAAAAAKKKAAEEAALQREETERKIEQEKTRRKNEQAVKATTAAKAKKDQALRTAEQEARAEVEAEQEHARHEAEQEIRAAVEAKREAKAAEAEKEKARLQAEQKAKAAEAKKEKARLKAEQETKAAEAKKEKARLKAEQEAKAEKARQEKARRKAEQEAKAAEAARLRAEQAELKRLEDEKKALERQEKQRLAAQKKALLKAEQEKKAKLREQKREEKKRAEEEAKAKRLAKAEAKREAAEEAERIKEQQAQEKLRELELAAELKAQQQKKHAEEFERLREQKAAEKTRREALDRAARERATQEELRIETLKAEQRRLEAEEIARVQAEKMYQLNQQDLATKIPERRTKIRPGKPGPVDMAQRDLPLDDDGSVRHLIPKNEPATSSARVKSTDSTTPDRDIEKPAQRSEKHTPAKSPRKSGAPNFFTLKPFRHTGEIRRRALRSAQIKPAAFAVSFIASLALLILCVRYVLVPIEQITSGASAIAVNQQSQLLLVAGDQMLMHDRSGLGTYSTNLNALGMIALSPPLAFTAEDELLVWGKAQGPEADNLPWQLFRCTLEEPTCQIVNVSSEIADVTDLAVDQRDGSLYIADTQSQKIFKTSSAGEILLQATVPVPASARIRLHQGLLYLNSDAAPAISVFRPDAQAFGTQLDEILLLPPAALKAEQTRAVDFTWSTGSWWVSLLNPESRSAGVYRFDSQWNFLGQIALEENTFPDQLLTWADKTLILDTHQATIQRFNVDGEAEVAVNSNTMEALLDEEQRSRKIAGALWRASLGALFLIAAAGLFAGTLHRLRNLVYRQGKERGAEPIADREKDVTWVPAAGTRDLRYQKVGVAYLAFSMIILIATATLTQSTFITLAIGVALAGPVVGLFLLYTTPTGHIGLLGSQLLLVDHHNFYHLGSGPRIFYRKYFVMLDDIVVFTGTPLLPAFDSKYLSQNLQAVITAGIKVDRKTLLVKLIERSHPLVKGAAATLGCLGLAGLVLLAA